MQSTSESPSDKEYIKHFKSTLPEEYYFSGKKPLKNMHGHDGVFNRSPFYTYGMWPFKFQKCIIRIKVCMYFY